MSAAPPVDTSGKTDDSLAEYRRKRDATRTPEPVPDAKSAKPTGSAKSTSPTKAAPEPAPLFVIQEHHASSLHWDFRLERDGVLVSWALPKGLPIDPGKNHLAVHTEDHPMEYATFEGEIPAGEYGGGQVTVWDHGSFTIQKWTDREVSIVLQGGKALGHYVLFWTRDDQWMIHRKDASPEGWEPLPERFAPMLASPGALPAGAGWAYEFKWDGIRAGVIVDGGRVHVRSRGGGDLTASFPELRALGEALGSTTLLLDGELMILDEQGHPNFGLIQPRLRVDDPRKAKRLAEQSPATLAIFDLLHLDGTSLVDLPYDQRRQRLERLKPLSTGGPGWALTPSFTDIDGAEVMRAAREAGLEGVVSKRVGSLYRSGRSDQWVKTKLVRMQEVLIGGYTAGNGSRRDTFGALILGTWGSPEGAGAVEEEAADPKGTRPSGPRSLVYAGRVGTGFTQADRQELLKLLRPLARKTSPFAHRPPDTDDPVWVRPTVVGEVQFTEWTRDGHLRHPSWRGLRRDKSPDDVVREP